VQVSVSVAQNLAHVRERIAAAAARARRDPGEVTLVAISKGFGLNVVEEAVAAGQRVFGENRVQEAEAKIRALPTDLEWHLVGHLQTNKVKRAVELFRCIHSVDSVELAHAIGRRAQANGLQLPVLLQVNVTGKESQSGVPPMQVLDLARQVADVSGIRLDGLMTIASYTEEEGVLRREFALLRDLRCRLQAAIPGHPWRHLSMGMSNDYEIAIEEGATLVRLGRALFGERPRPAQGG